MTPRFRLVLGDRITDLPTEGSVSLGSEDANDLVLAGDGVDPRHARIECGRGVVRIIDLASREGTRVNDRFVSREDIDPGDRISIGDHVLTLEEVSEAEEPAASSLLEISLPVVDDAANGGGRGDGRKRRPGRAAARRRVRKARIEPPRVKPPAPSAAPSAPEAAPVASVAAEISTPAPAKAPGDIPTLAPVTSSPRAQEPLDAPRASVPRAGRGRSTGVLAALAILAAIAGVAAVVILTSGTGEDAQARALLSRAEGLILGGDAEGAAKILHQVESDWPDTPVADRALQMLAAIAVDRRREEQATREIDLAWGERENLSRDEILARMRGLEERFDGTEALEAFGSIDRKVDVYFRQVQRDAFIAVREESDEALEGGNFRAAILAWREYDRLPERIPRNRLGAKAEIARIHAAAGEAFEVVRTEIAALVAKESWARALTELAAAERRLGGTPHAARARAEAAAVRAARATARGEVAEAVPTTPEELEAIESLQEAELLASERRYFEAAETYAKHVEKTSDPARKRDLVARLAELADLALLKGEVLRQVKEHGERFERIPLGETLEAKILEADDEGIELVLPEGRSRIAWRRMPDSRFLELSDRLKLDGPGLVALGRLCFLAGEEKRGHGVLADAQEAEAPKERIDAVLARALGIDVPEGGFALHRRRWYTPEVRDAVVLAERIEALAKVASGSDSRRAGEALAELRSLGKSARETLLVVLREKRDELRDRLFSTALGNAALVPALVKDLKQARKDALALIYDTKRYPYDRGSANPYGPNGAQVQKEVDDLVAKVVAVWADPLGHVATKWPALRKAIDALAVVDAEIAGLEGADPMLPSLLAAARDRIGLPAAADGKTYEKSVEVVAENVKVEPSVVNDEERSCVRAVNEYRMMMGLRAVRINAALTEASRQHSTEMAELNYFAHESPVPENRSPGMRARNADYKGGGVSENIARGATTGRGAHVQWCHSSGHHRNVLGRGHTEVGVGQAQRSWWTQMFGRGSGK